RPASAGLLLAAEGSYASTRSGQVEPGPAQGHSGAVTSDFSSLIDVQATLLCEAWDGAEITAVVFNDARRYLAANAAYCALTGYSREEMTDLRAGHNSCSERWAKQS